MYYIKSSCKQSVVGYEKCYYQSLLQALLYALTVFNENATLSKPLTFSQCFSKLIFDAVKCWRPDALTSASLLPCFVVLLCSVWLCGAVLLSTAGRCGHDAETTVHTCRDGPRADGAQPVQGETDGASGSCALDRDDQVRETQTQT